MCFRMTKMKVNLLLQDVFSYDEKHNPCNFFPKEIKIIATQFFKKMKKKFTNKERKMIAEEAISNQDKSGVAFKYGINIKTLYQWISKAKNLDNRHECISFRITDEEEMLLKEKFKENGQYKNLSNYIRARILSEFILEGEPEKLSLEVKQIKDELNAFGKKVNRIVHFTNLLKMNNKVSNEWVPDIRELTKELQKIRPRLKDVLERAIKKLPKN